MEECTFPTSIEEIKNNDEATANNVDEFLTKKSENNVQYDQMCLKGHLM